MHRCRHAVVSCMEEVVFLLHVRCTEHVACYLLHAAFMMRLARKANGSPWCAEGTNRTEFPCGFSSTAAVCRTCRTLAHGRAAPASDPCSCTAGYPQRTPPHSCTGSAFCPWDYTAPPPRICPGNPPHSCTGDWAPPPPLAAPDRAPSPFPTVPSRHSTPGTRPRPLPTSAPGPGPWRPHPCTGMGTGPPPRLVR